MRKSNIIIEWCHFFHFKERGSFKVHIGGVLTFSDCETRVAWDAAADIIKKDDKEYEYCRSETPEDIFHMGSLRHYEEDLARDAAQEIRSLLKIIAGDIKKLIPPAIFE